MTLSHILLLDAVAEATGAESLVHPFISAPSISECSPLLPRAAEPLASTLLLFPCLASNQDVLTKKQSLEHILFVLL